MLMSEKTLFRKGLKAGEGLRESLQKESGKALLKQMDKVAKKVDKQGAGK